MTKVEKVEGGAELQVIQEITKDLGAFLVETVSP